MSNVYHSNEIIEISGDECRVCLKKSIDMSQLFQNNGLLSHKLMELASVQIREGDGLPNLICSSCSRLLQLSYDFKCQVKNSDVKLREILKFNESCESNITSATLVKSIMEEVVSQISKEYGKETEQVNNEKNKSQQESDQDDSSNFDSYDGMNSLTECENPLKVEIRVKDELDGNYDFSETNEKDPMKVEEKSSREINLSDEEEQPLIHRTLRHKCPHCIKSFATNTLLERHVTIHKNKTKLRYVCHICDKQFSNISKLKNHITNNHDTAKTINSSENKKEDKKNSKFSCNVCSKQFTYQKSFNAHAKTHLECNPDDTSDEEKSTEQEKSPERNFQSNDKSDEINNEASLQCLQCGKIFATKRNLKRHISTHDGLKFDCPTCGKGFSRMDKLKDHEKSKHKEGIFGLTDDEENDDTDNEHSETSKKDKHNRLHKCSSCPKSFVQPQSLANHMERHKRVRDTQKRFLCEVCSKCFAQSGSLVAHMRTHTGVKPYVCNVCSRAFTKSTYLQLHLRTHSGEKPYICQYCSRAFARANTLARHITMHTGEAKYHCQICSKSFRRLTSLNEHTYTHTGQRPYACKICTKRYNNAGSLYAHVKKCKAQQSIRSQNALTAPQDNNTSAQSNNSTTLFIYSQRKLDDTPTGQINPSPQYMIANVHNQKTLSNNVIQPFQVDDSTAYGINSKQLKNPYYPLYPNM